MWAFQPRLLLIVTPNNLAQPSINEFNFFTIKLIQDNWFLTKRIFQLLTFMWMLTSGILHAKTIIRSETIFFATARTILEPGREFNY